MDDDRRATERSEDAALVARARGNDPDAFGSLYDRWFDRAHDLAYRITRDDAAAADVAQDAFVSAWQSFAKLENPEAFGGWLLRIARNGALDRKRRDARATPVDDEGLAVIESGGPSPASAPAGFRVEDRTRSMEDPARAVEDGELVALVWESAEALGERDNEILDLGLRHGLTPAEVGEVVGLNRNAANQAVHRVRGRLKAAVEARVLWRSGEPVCAGLAAALSDDGVTHFGADAVRVATQHAAICAECQERRQLRLEPSKMFVAIPILSVPLLKSKIAHALDNDGVPMGESAALHEHLPRGRRRVRARQLAAAGVAVVIVIFGVGAFAEDVEEATSVATGHAAPSTTGAPTTTTTVVLVPFVPLPGPATTTTSPPPFVALPGPAPDPGPPPPSDPLPTDPTPPEEKGTASISATVDAQNFVTVSWDSSGGTRVAVSGSGGVSSSSPSGSQTVCLGGVRGNLCTNAKGGSWTITVYGPNGQVLASDSAST